MGVSACQAHMLPLCSSTQSSDIPEGSLVTYMANAEEFAKAVANAGDKLVVVYFYATWYGKGPVPQSGCLLWDANAVAGPWVCE